MPRRSATAVVRPLADADFSGSAGKIVAPSTSFPTDGWIDIVATPDGRALIE